MVGELRQGPRQLNQKPAEPQQVQPTQVLFDVQTIEQLAEICKHYNLSQIQVGNIAVVNARPDPVDLSSLVNNAKPVSDEEILNNPYAGLNQ